MKISRILLDLDCVLVDFVSGCCRAWGLDPEDVYRYWNPGEYQMNDALTKALGDFSRPMSDEQFWTQLNGKVEFWADLEPLPWMLDLLEVAYLAVGRDNVHVVSSPSWCPTSYQGKVAWLKRQFGPSFNRFALTPHKEIFAMPGVVLIDDYEKNCDKFRNELDKFSRPAKGGAILFPAHHNGLHADKADPLPHVIRELDALNRA